MNVLIINKSDVTGGAAVVSYRLMEALNAAGAQARMLVVDKGHDDPRVATPAPAWQMKIPFLAERLKIFIANGFNRSTLFKIDTASDGLPLHKHPWVKQADVICLGWINQGMLSLKGIEKIATLGKPIVWTMHDMWNLTGICHHAGSCMHWKHQCGRCPLLLDRASEEDLSFDILQLKRQLYENIMLTSPDGKGIRFVAVSNWVANLARKSTLMHDADITVIPNPISFDSNLSDRREDSLEKSPNIKIMFGAARLDDPVKGLPILCRTMSLFAEDYPSLAGRVELVTFGSIKDPAHLQIQGVKHTHLGLLNGDRVKEELAKGHIILSTSLYETLPTTLIEGQVYGCIPVSLNRGGQMDIIEHKKTGYIAQWPDNDNLEETAQRVADGIAWGVKSIDKNGPAIRRAMYISAQERFSAPAIAARYLALFRSALGRN